jgi:endo-1,4-beta-mannosidase
MVWRSVMLWGLAIGLLGCGRAAVPPVATMVPCTPQAQTDLPAYMPSGRVDFVQVEGMGFVVGDESFRPMGVNYYPAQYPWRRFLTETPADTLTTELELLRATGFNTLRLFLWNAALFQCAQTTAIPNREAFLRLDAIIQQAAAYDFYLIVTLNDLPDLGTPALYDDPAHVRAQTTFIIERYRDEAAILAWDVRNEGDIDYGSNNNTALRHFPREQVLAWLDSTTNLIRSLGVPQLITAGWYTDQEATIPFVDVVSFHHWADAASLAERLAVTRAATEKPILLQEFGYSTQRMSEADQAGTIAAVLTTAETGGAAGWLLWTAFDFPIERSCYPSPCVSPDNAEHYFGLWSVDYTVKPAVEVVQAAMENSGAANDE